MHTFTANSVARTMPPRSIFAPSEAYQRRYEATPLMMLERHLSRTGIAPSRLGRLIANDSRLVFDLRAGREPQRKVIASIRAYFREAAHA